jgi:hypothetical protein
VWAQTATNVNCDGCVGTNDIATNGVRRSNIQNFSINTPKLSNFAVTTEKIKTDAVTTSKIEDGAVTAAKVEAKLSNAIGTYCAPGEFVVGIDDNGNLVCQAHLYYPFGPKKDIAVAELSGWTECHRSAFDTSGVDAISDISAACGGDKIMMACRPLNAEYLTLLAAAPKSDVFYDTGDSNNDTRNSNGTEWYRSDNYSWGFALGGETVNRSSCDYDAGAQTNPDTRMCIHTGGGFLQSGYRCGENYVNGAADWERVFYTN